MRPATLLLLLTSSFVFSCSPTQRYYVVRHAEKAGSTTMTDNRDPELSDAGKQRAAALASVLSGKKIQRVFVTSTLRSKSTAAPVASLFNITPLIYSPKPDSSFIRELRSLKGSTLIVAHSNTVDDIVNQLAGFTQVPADLPDSSYDRLYLISIRKGRIRFSETTYGKPTP